jgi:hypothetical protein
LYILYDYDTDECTNILVKDTEEALEVIKAMITKLGGEIIELGEPTDTGVIAITVGLAGTTLTRSGSFCIKPVVTWEEFLDGLL